MEQTLRDEEQNNRQGEKEIQRKKFSLCERGPSLAETESEKRHMQGMNTESAVRRESSYIRVRAERLGVRGHTKEAETIRS